MAYYPPELNTSQYVASVQGTAGNITFSNSNGITFGGNNSTITASHNALTTAAQSNHSHGNPTLNLTNLSGTTGSNSAGFTLSLSAAAPGGGGLTNINVSAGTTSNNLSAMTFSNSNGISFGLNASTITASHNALTTAAQSDHSHGNPTLALTNLTGTTASASNGLTISLSAAPPGAGGGFAAQGSGTYTQNTGTIQFANSNGITFGLSTNQMTASHNGLTTAAQSDHSHGNPTLALTNLTGTTASASNGFTLSLSAAAPGAGAAPVVSRYPTADMYYGNISSAPLYAGTSGSTGGSTQFTVSGRVWSEAIPFDIHYKDLDMAATMSATASGTGSASIYHAFGIYTLNGNTVLSRVSSFYHGQHMSQNSITARTHYAWWGSNSAANTTTANGNISASWSGFRRFDLHDSDATLSAGNYFFAHFMYQRSSAANVFSQAGIAHRTASQTSGFSYFGTNTFVQPFGTRGLGIFSTTTNTNTIQLGIQMPASIATSAITGTGGSSQNLQPFFWMYRNAT